MSDIRQAAKQALNDQESEEMRDIARAIDPENVEADPFSELTDSEKLELIRGQVAWIAKTLHGVMTVLASNPMMANMMRKAGM